MTALWRIAPLVLWLFTVPGFSQEPGKQWSVPEYMAELDRLSAAVQSSRDAQSIRESIGRLPPQWTVRVKDRTFQIDNEWLKTGLVELKGKGPDAAHRLILERIAVLKAGVQAFQQPPRDVSSCKNALAGILARREFRNVHGPTLWDKLKERLLLFMVAIIERIFGSSTFSTVSRILVWILVALAALVLAAWIYNTLRRTARLEEVALKSSPVSAKSWSVWMAEARAAAARGVWRDAIHLSYWAGISSLESRGLWRPDKARTPREYLRLLTSSSEYRDPLSALTRRFEVVWYGDAEAGPDSFSEVLKHLESLGCHSN